MKKYHVTSGSLVATCLSVSAFNAAVESLAFAKASEEIDGVFNVRDIESGKIDAFDCYDVLSSAGWIVE
jgi:hypothetical protein